MKTKSFSDVPGFGPYNVELLEKMRRKGITEVRKLENNGKFSCAV